MNSMCVVCLTNYESREARGGTSVALAPPTSSSICLKVAHFHLEFTGVVLNFTIRVSIENPK